jgi:hypothetical protein
MLDELINMVDQTGASWNQIREWLRRLEVAARVNPCIAVSGIRQS